jgi:hypothetical protein
MRYLRANGMAGAMRYLKGKRNGRGHEIPYGTGGSAREMRYLKCKRKGKGQKIPKGQDDGRGT